MEVSESIFPHGFQLTINPDSVYARWTVYTMGVVAVLFDGMAYMEFATSHMLICF